jgi:exopolysaccharide biosynthesis polyprenyl glycosylphosphotransferase
LVLIGVLGADVLTITLTIFLGSLARAQWNVFGEELDTTWTLHLAVTHGPWMGLVWLLWLGARGGYSRKLFAAGGEEFNRVFVASLLTAGTVAMICYLSQYELSRGFVTMTFVIGTPLLLVERFAARKTLHRLRTRGAIQNRVVVVGDADATAQIIDILRRERCAGYTVVAACPPAGFAVSSSSSESPVPVLGGQQDVREVALSTNADTVLVAGGHFADASDVRKIAWSLEGTDVDLIVVPSLTDIAGPRVHVRPVAGLPLLHIEPPQADEAVRWGKRAFDVIASLMLLVAGLPVWFAVMVAIKLGDGGPVFFRQRRVGLHGDQFDCLKFRSMSCDAEDTRTLLLHLNESDGPLFKIREDPRITQVGRFIRRYSLDELPQLINVLRGQMSLVGPRPPLPCEVDQYGEAVGRRLLVRPGMTGLWQVSGRSSLSWDDAVRLDLYYVDNWSLFQDVVILLKTTRAVLSSQGAS